MHPGCGPARTRPTQIVNRREARLARGTQTRQSQYRCPLRLECLSKSEARASSPHHAPPVLCVGLARLTRLQVHLQSIPGNSSACAHAVTPSLPVRLPFACRPAAAASALDGPCSPAAPGALRRAPAAMRVCIGRSPPAPVAGPGNSEGPIGAKGRARRTAPHGVK